MSDDHDDSARLEALTARLKQLHAAVDDRTRSDECTLVSDRPVLRCTAVLTCSDRLHESCAKRCAPTCVHMNCRWRPA